MEVQMTSDSRDFRSIAFAIPSLFRAAIGRGEHVSRLFLSHNCNLGLSAVIAGHSFRSLQHGNRTRDAQGLEVVRGMEEVHGGESLLQQSVLFSVFIELALALRISRLENAI